jgi:4-methylaminobutanoate oxidase (formaldehyde-forming)
MATQSFPTQAKIVIVGGGIAGCSVAYHLAKLGQTDVVLLEQGKLTSGTTWHAAGLVGQMRPNRNMTRMSKCGSVNVARTPERMKVLRKQIALARSFGVEVHEITPQEVGERAPLLRTDDLAGGIWIPGDGKANPADLCMSLAKGARLHGIKIFEDIEVTGVDLNEGRVQGVKTKQGDIQCDILVNCAGQWARQFGQLAGVNVPLYSAEHFYIVTDKIEGIHPMWPVVR